jgi:hypothetical protein
LRVSGERSEPLASATDLGAENSEVPTAVTSSNVGRAVAVTVCPTGTLAAGEKAKLALPLVSVTTIFWPTNFLPSLPEGLEKNSTTKPASQGLLLSLPG